MKEELKTNLGRKGFETALQDLQNWEKKKTWARVKKRQNLPQIVRNSIKVIKAS